VSFELIIVTCVSVPNRAHMRTCVCVFVCMYGCIICGCACVCVIVSICPCVRVLQGGYLRGCRQIIGAVTIWLLAVSLPYIKTERGRQSGRESERVGMRESVCMYVYTLNSWTSLPIEWCCLLVLLYK